MSAAVISSRYSRSQPFDAKSFCLSVSQRTAKAQPSLPEIARMLLLVPGVQSVELTLPESWGGVRQWVNGSTGDSLFVEAGLLRVGFEQAQEQPDLVQFVSEQITATGQRLALLEEREKLQQRKEALARRVETRKVYLRASALLQVNRKLTEQQSCLFLLRSARSLRRPMLHVCRTVISIEEPVVPITRRPRKHYSR